MAGLLAWAADVVAGNGQQQVDEEEESPWRGVGLRLGAEDQEEVRQLEERAAVLHQTIQHLRLRIPPPDISRSLPQLHADSLAAHSALTSELNAHEMTQKESQAREKSLRAENAAYANAISNAQQQLQGKRQELLSLNARLQEMEKELLLLTVELDNVSSSLAKRETGAIKGSNKETPVFLFSDKTFKEGEELRKTRAELKMWEMNVARLEREWSSVLQSSTRWPSAAQREKELERRLRVLSEQLMTKQGQADGLLRERNSLQLRLNEASQMKRQASSMMDENHSYKGKTRKISTSGDSKGPGFKPIFQTGPLESAQATRVLTATESILRQASNSFLSVVSTRKTMDANLCTSSALRCFIVLYVLILHLVPFAVILSAT